MKDIITHLNLFSAQFCFIILLAILVMRNKTLAHYLLMGQVFCATISSTISYMALNPNFHDFRYTFFLHIPAGFFIGPLMLSYVYYLTREDYKLNRKQSLIFALPVLSLILTPVFFVLYGFPPLREALAFYEHKPLSVLDLVTSIAYVLDFIFYLVIIKNLLFFFRPSNLRNPITLMVLFCFFTIAVVSTFSLISIITRDINWMGLAGASILLVAAMITLAAQRFPELLEGLRDMAA